jgi:hypothetical protein
MLGMDKYPNIYIQACRSRAASQVTAYKKLARAVKNDSALAAFEPVFFNNMVLTLDEYFVHRLRKLEGKDGNPLNEVRAICNSLMLHDGVMTAENPIKMKPAQTVLKIEFGDQIRVTEADFAALSKAFFAEIEAKYS